MPLDINLHATIIGSVVVLILNSKFNNNNKYWGSRDPAHITPDVHPPLLTINGNLNTSFLEVWRLMFRYFRSSKHRLEFHLPLICASFVWDVGGWG